MKYRVLGHGRQIDAPKSRAEFFVKDLESDSEESAKLEIYDYFEDISNLKVTSAPTKNRRASKDS